MMRLLMNKVAYMLLVLLSISLTSCAGWWILGGAGTAAIIVGSSGDDDDDDDIIVGSSGDTWTWTATTLTDAPSARTDHTVVWTDTEMIIWGGAEWPGPTPADTGAKYYPITNTWISITTNNVPISRYFHTAVWTGNEMIVWGGNGGGGGNYLNTGTKYYPITDTWTAITTDNAPISREDHTAVWTGNEMIIWGGYAGGATSLNTGAKYYPITDTWVSITDTDAPTSRTYHTVVWTGQEMIVWGGVYGGGWYNTGAKYYPVTDTWIATTTDGAPSGREYHTAVWTGTEMIIWGGYDNTGTGVTNTGAKYNPASDTWTPITTSGAPSARWEHTAVWTGTEMIIWGGYDAGGVYCTDGAKYIPSTDKWTPVTTTNMPSARILHTAIWTGIEMIIWGGWNGDDLNTGGRYKP